MEILPGIITIIEMVALFNFKGIMRFFGVGKEEPAVKDTTTTTSHLMTVFIILTPLLAFLGLIMYISK